MSTPFVMSALVHPESLPPFSARLGLTFLHALWEGVVIAGMLAVALSILNRAAPTVRYWASCAAMAALPVVAAVTFALLPAGNSIDAPAPTDASISVAQPLHRATAQIRSSGSTFFDAGNANHTGLAPDRQAPGYVQFAFGPALPLLGAVWILGVCGVSVYRLGGWLYLHRMLNHASVVASPWPRVLLRLCQRLEISRPVRLLQSSYTAVPLVAGWLRPVVLLPVSAINNMPVDQIEALLAHELAHIRRNDYLVNLILTAIETMFFYHPLAWWISRQVRREREDCCDDIAAELSGSRVLYARALAELEESRLAFAPALGASDGNLLRRIRRILGRHDSVPPAAGAVMLMVCFLLAAAGWLAFASAQPQTKSPAPATQPASENSSSTVSGRVVDSNGKPVAGASVLVTRTVEWPEAETLASTTSANDGAFSIRYSRPTPKAEWERVTLLAFAPNVGLSLQQPPEGGKKLELRLLPSAELHVPFVGSDGRPIIGMGVWPKVVGVRRDPVPLPRFEALPIEVTRQMMQRTDANGVCVFRGLPRDSRVQFDVDDDRFAAMNAHDYVPLERDGVIQADPIQLKDAGSIAGSVVYSDSGRPAAGLHVFAGSLSMEQSGGSGWTDASGHYQIRRLKPGRFIVILGDNDPAGEWVAKAVEVDVAADRQASADLAMIHGGILTGRVRDQETLKGFAGLHVALHGPAKPEKLGAVQAGVTDSQGVYRIRVAPGRQSVYLMDEPPDGYLRPEANPFHTQDIVVGDGRIVTLNIDLPRDKSPAVSGTVLGPDGKPVAGATVIYPRDERDMGWFDRFVKSGPDGRFRARDVPPSAEFRARLNDLATLAPVKYRGDGHELMLRLSDRGTYKALVRVKDDLGNVVAGASVSLTTWHGRMGEGSQPHPTGADGTVRFDKLYSDTHYSVSSTTRGRGESNAEIHPPEEDKPGEQVVELKIFSAGGVVAGVVVDEKGRPVPDAEVLLSGPGFGAQTTHADANGKFKFSVVSSMRGWLYLPAGKNGQGLPIMADVKAGDTDIRLVLHSIAKANPPDTPSTRPAP
jgi:beta-lactamase regulating signal transducer with metallopeptidase domain